MKGIITLLTAAFIFTTVAVVGTGQVFAATTTCTIKSVQGSTVTLDCGDDADDYSTGMKVKIKESKKRKRLEGC